MTKFGGIQYQNIEFTSLKMAMKNKNKQKNQLLSPQFQF